MNPFCVPCRSSLCTIGMHVAKGNRYTMCTMGLSSKTHFLSYTVYICNFVLSIAQSDSWAGGIGSEQDKVHGARHCHNVGS